MAYEPSPQSKKLVDKLNRLGKRLCLVPYTYNPPLEKAIDFSCVVLLVLALPAGLVFKSWLYPIVLIALCIVLFTIRELLVYVVPDDPRNRPSVGVGLVKVLKVFVAECIFEQIPYSSERAVYPDQRPVFLNEKLPYGK